MQASRKLFCEPQLKPGDQVRGSHLSPPFNLPSGPFVPFSSIGPVNGPSFLQAKLSPPESKSPEDHMQHDPRCSTVISSILRHRPIHPEPDFPLHYWADNRLLDCRSAHFSRLMLRANEIHNLHDISTLWLCLSFVPPAGVRIG